MQPLRSRGRHCAVGLLAEQLGSAPPCPAPPSSSGSMFGSSHPRPRQLQSARWTWITGLCKCVASDLADREVSSQTRRGAMAGPMIAGPRARWARPLPYVARGGILGLSRWTSQLSRRRRRLRDRFRHAFFFARRSVGGLPAHYVRHAFLRLRRSRFDDGPTRPALVVRARCVVVAIPMPPPVAGGPGRVGWPSGTPLEARAR